MTQHAPVLLDEVLDALAVDPAGIYVDATYGRGGHAGAVLKRLGPGGRLVVLDRDPEAIAHGERELANDERCLVRHATFAELRAELDEVAVTGRVNGLLFDLGVSSPQLDAADRGFSFLADGPLDMRMDPTSGVSAAQWLARAEVRDIAHVLRRYGEERHARRIARAIVARREQEPLTRTGELAELVAQALPRHERKKHPATRTFQALRIFINGELDQVEQALEQSLDVLASGGRLVVISFHSLEDRIVKRFMRRNARVDPVYAGLPLVPPEAEPKLRLVGKATRPTPAETERNRRARSAVLRVAERLAA